MKFQAVLFDAADTLFTTRGSVGEIYASVARQYGSTAASDEIQAAFKRSFRGAGPLSVRDQKAWWKTIVHSVFEEVGMIANFDDFFDHVYDRFRDSNGWTLFPETLEVLNDLSQLNLKLGLVSNFDTRIYSVLESLRIRHFFTTVTLSSETGFSKPDPEIFEVAIKALDTPAAQILLVGDNLHDDIEAGTRAGLSSVLIDRTGRFATRNDVRRIATLKEVVPLVKVHP